MSTEIKRTLPNDEYQAAINSSSPSSTNPFATEAITDALQVQINAITPGNVLISGGVVWSGTGFTYDVSALEYKIQGVTYTTLPTSVTLSAADPSNPRIDVIYADDTGAVGVLTGTPSGSPVKPSIDTATQIELTFVAVPAGSTTPVISTVLIYNENIGAPGEWNTSSDDVNVNFNSTLDPYSGVKSVNTQLPLGINREIIFTRGTPYPVNGGVLSFRIKAKNAMNTAGGRVYVGFFNGATLQGNAVYIGGSNATIYGFNPNNTTSYQLVSIPMSAFGVLPATVGALRLYRLTGTSTANFFLDLVQIQEGVVTVPSAAPGHVIYEETTQLAQRTKLSFVGAGVTASDDPGNDRTIVTIPGGVNSLGSIVGDYKVDTAVGGNPAPGYIRYNNATQTAATVITIDHLTDNGIDIDILLALITSGSSLIIQDKDDSANYQIFTITGPPVETVVNDYWSIPVAINTSGGLGTTNFANNQSIIVANFAAAQPITISGEASGSGTTAIALTLSNAAVISKVLTGYVSGAGVITATDTILQAIQKLNGNIGSLVTGVSSVYGRTGVVTAQSGDYNTSQVTENTNLYFTNARVLAAVLTGYVSGSGVISATDTVLQAIQKLNGNVALKQDALTLTTTGTSGPATLVGSTLNIPQYSGGGGGSSWTVTTQSGASYTAANNDFVLINAATQTVTLPAATANARVGVKMINATVTNIQVKTASAGVTIDGVDRSATGLPIYNQWDSLTFIADGTNWFIQS